MRNTFFHYLAATGYPVYTGKEGGKIQFVKIDVSEDVEDAVEHHVSVYQYIENNKTAMQSQYHYTMTLGNNDKLRVYFNEHDKIVSISGMPSWMKVQSLKEQADKVVLRYVLPLKKAHQEDQLRSMQGLDKGLFRLSEISKKFPESFSLWKDEAKVLVEMFRGYEGSQNEVFNGKLSFIRQFLEASLPLVEKKEVISPESQPESAGSMGEDFVPFAEESKPDEFSKVALIDRFEDVIQRISNSDALDLDSLSKDYDSLKIVGAMLNERSCPVLSHQCFEKAYSKIGLLAQLQLDQLIQNREVEKVKKFTEVVDLKEIGYKPQTLAYLFVKDQASSNVELLTILAKSGVFDPMSQKLRVKGSSAEHTLLQYAYVKKNKLLMLFALAHGASLLDAHIDGMPIFYRIFHNRLHPCRELFTHKDVSQKLDKSFFTALYEKLQGKDVNDDAVTMLKNLYNGSADQNREMLRGDQLVGRLGVEMGKGQVSLIMSDPRFAGCYKRLCEGYQNEWNKLNTKEKKIFIELSKKGGRVLEDGFEALDASGQEELKRRCDNYELYAIQANAILRTVRAAVRCIKLKMYQHSNRIFFAQPNNSKQKEALCAFSWSIYKQGEEINQFLQKQALLEASEEGAKAPDTQKEEQADDEALQFALSRMRGTFEDVALGKDQDSDLVPNPSAKVSMSLRTS